LKFVLVARPALHQTQHYQLESSVRATHLIWRRRGATCSELASMISGPPPGRVARLFSAWVDWLFEKLSPPQPKPRATTEPPKLVKTDRNTSASRTASRR
jgi:hypothetical protein